MVDAMRRPLLAAAAVAAAGALAASLLVPLPDPFPLVRELSGALGAWSYAVVAAVVFLETSVGLGLPSPGEVVLAVSGAAAGTGDLSLAVLLAVVWGCGVAGDSVSWLADRGILVAPGDFYGAAGAQHVRIAFTATDEGVAAAVSRLTG